MRRAIIGWATAWAAGLGVPASAQVPGEGTPVLPLSVAEGSLVGLPPSEDARFQSVDSGLAEVGDVNGDGITDVAVGTGSADPRGRRDAGIVRVLFGGSPLGRIDLRSPRLAGFRILGPRPGRRRPAPVFAPDSPPEGAMAGTSVAGAGDINGDGLDDVLVAAPFLGNRRRSFSGSVYVVFGKRSRHPVDLARMDGGGYRIDGPHRGSAAGYALAGPGDVSGDGRPDVVLSTWDAVYVVHGQAGTAPVDLRRSAGQGFVIRGRRPFYGTGAAVSGAGDFNGDGLADVAVGAPFATVRRRAHAGATFVFFGRPDSRPLSLARLDRRGVRIDGEHEVSHLGAAIAPLGDVNGDGRSDLLVGASLASASGRRYAGAAYVVFGRPDPGALDLRRPDGAAYRILGPGRLGASGGIGQGRAGVSVAAIGDVNGDERPDMIIGAPGAGRRCSPEEGAAYVVFGQPFPSPLDLDRLGGAGYAIRGGLPDANAGVLVAGAGDWNQDGRGDMLVLRADFDDSRRGERPLLDLVFGRLPPPLPAAPTAEQLPRISVPRPNLRRLAGGRGITARLTVHASGPADAVLVEVYSAALGDELPVALGYTRFSRPQTKTVKLIAPKFVRRLLRGRSRLRARVVLSQCSTAGNEYTAQSRIVLRRR
jgi:hypothetical protein